MKQEQPGEFGYNYRTRLPPQLTRWFSNIWYRWTIYRLIFGVAVIGFLSWWVFWPSAGEREFRRSMEALSKAGSWREEYSGPGFSQRAEYSCPDAGRWSIVQTLGDSGLVVTNDYVALGVKSYSRHSIRQPSGLIQTYPWQAELRRSALPCAYRADLEGFIRTSVISKGGIEIVHDAKCRDWRVQVISGRAQGRAHEDHIVCIGIDDHLPRRMDRRLFFEWNSPIHIEAPIPQQQ